MAPNTVRRTHLSYNHPYSRPSIDLEAKRYQERLLQLDISEQQQEELHYQALSPGQNQYTTFSHSGSSPYQPAAARQQITPQPDGSPFNSYMETTGIPTQSLNTPISPMTGHSLPETVFSGWQGFADQGQFGGQLPMAEGTIAEGLASQSSRHHSALHQMPSFPSLSPNPMSPHTDSPDTNFEFSFNSSSNLMYPSITSRSQISPPIMPATPNIERQAKRQVPNASRPARACDIPIGIVYANKKFKCSKRDCHDLTFGRLADLRRHYEQAHSGNRVQYFCSVRDCVRNQFPSNGSKGRSFGTRKDKKDEHERNVHRIGKQEVETASEQSLEGEGSSTWDAYTEEL